MRRKDLLQFISKKYSVWNTQLSAIFVSLFAFEFAFVFEFASVAEEARRGADDAGVTAGRSGAGARGGHSRLR